MMGILMPECPWEAILSIGQTGKAKSVKVKLCHNLYSFVTHSLSTPPHTHTHINPIIRGTI